jgi:hypothetical protein
VVEKGGWVICPFSSLQAIKIHVKLQSYGVADFTRFPTFTRIRSLNLVRVKGVKIGTCKGKGVVSH